MLNGATYLKYMDVPDVSDALSFFAVQSISDPTLWTWRYGLTFESTSRFGGEGKAGDGIDVVVLEGRSWLPQAALANGDEERSLDNIATAHIPAIPQEALDEYWDDSLLCEMSGLDDGRKSFKELALEACEVDEPTQEDLNRIEALREYATANHWDFGEGR